MNIVPPFQVVQIRGGTTERAAGLNRVRFSRLTCWLLGGAGIVFTAHAGFAQSFEHVITFDNVVVRGGDLIDSPEVAHREIPGLDNAAPSVEWRSDGIGPKPGAKTILGSAQPPIDSARSMTGSPPLPKVSVRVGPLLPFEPSDGTNNPSFVQAGFLVEAFWAGKIGTVEGFFKRAHFHPADLSTGYEGQHFGNPNELHGLYIRSLDRKRFGLKSLRYRVTRNRQLPTKSFSIEGFTNFNVNVLIGRSFDPRIPIRPQFMLLPVGLPVGNETKLPWATLRVFGFELVDQLYIASSASVDLDNIVLTRREPSIDLPDQPQKDD